MKIQSRLFSIAFLFVLILSFIPQADVSAATDYELVSVTGVWTDTDGGGTTVTGLNTNEVKWGYSSGYGQSGLRFDGASGQSFDEGDNFLLGTLTHKNWPVYSPSATGATLKITLVFANPSVTPNPTFTFDFSIYETTNAGQCPAFHDPSHPKCDDRITFPNSYGEESFSIGDSYYTLKIEGFVDSFPSGSPVDNFVTEEKKDNSAYLVASLSSVLVEEPDITLTKKTNSQDIASAPGPELVVGDSVSWSYIVQNTGNVNLWNIQIIDDQIGAISCPSTSLASGASMTCTASGTVTAGQYHNHAVVTANHSSGSVNDSDDSWYVGIEAGVDIEKYVWDGSSWFDADSGPGPSLVGDDDVLFKFVVTNTGDVDLTDTELADNYVYSLYTSLEFNSTCFEPDPFVAGSSFTCYGPLAWEEGQHENVGWIGGYYNGEQYTDMDKAHYFGVSPDIDVAKSILVGSTWVDADSSPGPSIDDNGDVIFRFIVKNTGSVTLSNLSLSDDKMTLLFSDQALTLPCVAPASLAPDASFTCYGGLSWAEGQHVNEAKATGDYDGNSYDDTDKSHYFGIAPEIDVEKSVYDGSNWVDADSEPGPSIMGGSDVLFRFVVENTGNVNLSSVSLSDNKIASLYSDQALTLPCTEPDSFTPGASFTCYGDLSWAEGQHVNEATATVIYGGVEIEDKDKAHYYGTAPEIDVEKSVLVGSTWFDADSSPGPSIEDGGDVIFRFTVKNTGSVTLSNLSLSDDKMASLYSDQARTSPCVEPASLAPDASFTCYGSMSWAEGQHVNEATAAGDYNGVSYDDTDKAHYFGIAPSIDVEKSVWNGSTWEDADAGSGPDLWSDSVFKFVVTNDGNLELTNVQLSDSLISSLYADEALTNPCSNGITMQPDDSFTCYGTLSWAAGQHENTASVSGSVYGSTVDDSDKAHYFGPNPDIDVEKVVWTGSSWSDADSAPGPVIGSGSNVLFRFVVRNTGNVALSGVSLGDSMIASLFSDQALTTPCVENAPFGVGENFTCYGSLSWAAGQHQNTVTASGSYDGHPTSDTDLAHYYGATVSIDVEKNVWNGASWEDADTGDGPTLLDGNDPVFRFVVTNTSNVALSNIQLSDNLISMLYSDEALTNPCTEPASLAVSGSFTCYGSLSWAAGNHENTATVSAQSNGLPANDTDLAHYLGADPEVTLTKSADVDVFTQVDEIITYTFVAENTGNMTLYNVVISDPLPNLSSLDCSASMPATLTPGSSITCTATYEVKQADIDAGKIENTAAVEGTDSYDRTVEDEDGVELEGPKEGASIVLEKTADPEIFVAVDDVITYTFVATNNGTFTLSNVVIADPLPNLSDLACEPVQPAELAPGESMTCTATYTILQEDINAGIVENTATVTGEASNGDEVEDDDDAVVEGPKEEASIHLDKKAEPATYQNVGDKITYTFTVTNNGIYTLTDVTVTDPLFSLTYGPIEVFEPGDSMTYKYTYTITKADIDAGSILNVATAMGYDPDEEPVSSTDDAIVDRPQPKEEEETLPTTGFAPNQITTLPMQSLDQAYTTYSDLWLEIPSLGINVDIVGVPETASGWDVTWLDRKAGWLNGTTFPTWPGNSFVTGHVWDAYDQPGPFVDLNKLQWGDKIIVHLNGSAYTFEVRTKLTVEPDDLSLIEQAEDYSWLNLMTCKEFNEDSGVYDYRLIVRAVLVGMD